MVASNAESVTPSRFSEEDRETSYSVESGSQDGTGSSGSPDELERERILGALRAWANFSISFTGGIVGQLISEAEEELADQQDCINWYEQEILRSQSAKEWHQAKTLKIQRRLQGLRETLANIPTAPEDINETS